MLGCGTVGSGVAHLLLNHAERMTRRAGRPLLLKHVVVRDATKQRACELPAGMLTTDLDRVLGDPDVHVVVELAGGTTWARKAALAALATGRDLVTANKALLARHGTEIFAAAHQRSRAVAFEAAVAGGIPIIGAISQGLAANQISSVQGILNGTCNFILTAMTERGSDYAGTLAEAQRLGYAEADPTLDVDGSDAAHKLAVLVRLAFGMAISPDDITRRGIAEIASVDIRYAVELGYVIKLLAEAWSDGESVALHVSPTLVRKGTPLAETRDAFNAVKVTGDAAGETLFSGAGAGMMPTASAVVADIIDLATGRAQKMFAAQKLWQTDAGGLTIRPTDDVLSRFYLRLTVADRPGVLAEVATLLAMEGISIASVIQHEAPEDAPGQSVVLVAMTHTAKTGQFRAALDRINQSDNVREAGVYYPVAD
jgi:homoserine dehydrogenase